MSFRSELAKELFGRGEEYRDPTRKFVNRGCFGCVYRCTKGEKTFAEKVVRCRPNGEESEILREFDVMCLVWSANKELFLEPLFLEIDREQETATIGMEWFDGETLGNTKEKDAFEEKLYTAAKELNSVGVSHRDLNRGNILVSKDGNIKVIDFGSTTLLDEEKVVFVLSDYISGSEEEEQLEEEEAKLYQLFEFFRLFATKDNMEKFLQEGERWAEILQFRNKTLLMRMLCE